MGSQRLILSSWEEKNHLLSRATPDKRQIHKEKASDTERLCYWGHVFWRKTSLNKFNYLFILVFKGKYLYCLGIGRILFFFPKKCIWKGEGRSLICWLTLQSLSYAGQIREPETYPVSHRRGRRPRTGANTCYLPRWAIAGNRKQGSSCNANPGSGTRCDSQEVLIHLNKLCFRIFHFYFQDSS